VRRTATLTEAFSSSTPSLPVKSGAASKKTKTIPTDRLDEALQWLKGMQKIRRPSKRKALAAHLFNHFGKKIPEDKIQAFIDLLIAEKELSDVKGAITYHF
jgi:hypothetical protein